MTDWFEPLYAQAADGAATVPWDRDHPNPIVVAWAESIGLQGRGRSAIVVGCGYGRDSEYLATLGFAVTAFDVAPSAIDGARRRHPSTTVDYRTADLLDLPDEWVGAFAFVLESHNVQALPGTLRPTAIAAVRSLVAPGGTLVVSAAGRDDGSVEPDGPPWPLLRSEIDSFGEAGVTTDEVVSEVDEKGILRWRASFSRLA